MAAAAIALTFATASRPKAADDVSFVMDWIINGAHAGYFMAVEKGFYRDEGLNVAGEAANKAVVEKLAKQLAAGWKENAPPK